MATLSVPVGFTETFAGMHGGKDLIFVEMVEVELEEIPASDAPVATRWKQDPGDRDNYPGIDQFRHRVGSAVG